MNNTNEKNSLVVSEEGWFGQPKYSTLFELKSTSYRAVLAFGTIKNVCTVIGGTPHIIQGSLTVFCRQTFSALHELVFLVFTLHFCEEEMSHCSHIGKSRGRRDFVIQVKNCTRQ